MLERILNSNGQIVPETGFVGFVLHNWVTLAIVTMLLGFIIDQVLYFVRYRPQDDWKHAYYSFRRFLTDTGISVPGFIIFFLKCTVGIIIFPAICLAVFRFPGNGVQLSPCVPAG